MTANIMTLRATRAPPSVMQKCPSLKTAESTLLRMTGYNVIGMGLVKFLSPQSGSLTPVASCSPWFTSQITLKVLTMSNILCSI